MLTALAPSPLAALHFGDWLSEHEALLWWLFAGSVASLVLAAVLLPVIVVRLPADHFAANRRKRPEGSGWWQLPLRIGRNLLGAVFVLAGVAMLVLPGQGVLTLLIGLLMLEFPGKRKLERALIRRPKIRRMLDRMRKKRGRPPFEVD
jgi:hypothetical protein